MTTAEKLSITLPADMVSIIKAEVETGRYASTSEVLREAMRMWMRQEEVHLERLQAIRGRLKNSLDDPRPSLPAEEAFARLEAMFQDGDAA
jgi:antitoxin ParD1/3/4